MSRDDTSQDNFRLRWETLLDLFGLPESGIAGGKEKILFHHRLKIDKYYHQHEQHGRDREHLPVRAEPGQLVGQREFHRFNFARSRNCIGARCRVSCSVAKKI
jgi:hypothetical protein